MEKNENRVANCDPFRAVSESGLRLTKPNLRRSSATRWACGSPEDWLRFVQNAVQERLGKLFEEKEAAARRLEPTLSALVHAIRDLTMRGGKRLRPALLIAGFQSVTPDRELDAVMDAAVAAELLQTFLLIHDDWMDQDEMRRGYPTLHVTLSAQYGNRHTGASVAILAGNLAAAYAWEALTSTLFPSDVVRRALRAFWEMEEQVALGQFLDIVGSPSVQTTYMLKSASYSTRGPLRIGALLGGGSEGQLGTLDRYGWPLGNAFQLRDDLLSTFGDPAETGKPVGGDLRSGKRTALITDALKNVQPRDRALLDNTLGNPNATSEEIVAVTRLLEDCGSRSRVEALLQRYVDDALHALDDGGLRPQGNMVLQALAKWIASRSH